MRPNLSRSDRVIRVAVGGVAISAGLIAVRGAWGALLAVTGAVLIFSGSVGFCHVRDFLGRLRTRSKK